MRLLVLPAVFCAAALPQADQYDPLYRGDAGEVFSRKPNAFLVEMVRQRKPVTALDVGMGQGWTVTGFDSADEGIRQANAEAKRLGLDVRAEVNTFEKFDFGEARWDLIVLT